MIDRQIGNTVTQSVKPGRMWVATFSFKKSKNRERGKSWGTE